MCPREKCVFVFTDMSYISASTTDRHSKCTDDVVTEMFIFKTGIPNQPTLIAECLSCRTAVFSSDFSV